MEYFPSITLLCVDKNRNTNNKTNRDGYKLCDNYFYIGSVVMDIRFVTALITVAGALVGVWIGSLLSKRASREAVKATHQNAIDLMQKQNVFAAASKFKATILYELIGFYPTDQIWDENEFPRLLQSISKIKCAAAEFRYFVKRKTEFDAAIKEYHNYCQQGKYKNGVPHMTYPNSPTPFNTTPDPLEEFKNIVEHMLSFANEIL